MKEQAIGWLKRNEKISVFILILFFVLIRLPGVHLPLHQDEYKWPEIVNPVSGTGFVPHPPLGEFIYRNAGYIVGFNTNFRLVPLLFGALNLLLLYYFVRMVFDRRTAVIAGIVWIFSYFSVLASLMVDTDGEFLPFFFLLSLIGYYKLKNTNQNRVLWSGILLISLVCGILIKLSFILAIGAILADFLWSKKDLMKKKDLLKYLSWLGFFVAGIVLLLIFANKIFPLFDLSRSLSYWEHFFTLNRGWFQTFIQVAKAVLYYSPLLILLPFFLSKDSFSKVRVFFFFLLFAFIFYILIFDFSTGALDRYLQLLILPLSTLSSIVISEFLKLEDKRGRQFIFFSMIVSLALILFQSFPHYVSSLYPKSEWISRILSLHWNFLYPFFGGSGPLGFYVSFMFIGLSWALSISALIVAKIKPQYKKLAFVFIVSVGLAYNAVFIEEYLFGFWNGHAPKLLYSAVEFMKNNPEIEKVTVYNDNGGYEVQSIGKYRKRLYIDPKFDIAEKIKTLNTYKEHYFVLDIPPIPPESVYQKYFDTCKPIYNKVDKKMSATIYDCRGVPDIKI